MRKNIYVPDGFDWEGLEKRAGELGISVSKLLLDSWDPVLVRIEGKLDLLLKNIDEFVEVDPSPESASTDQVDEQVRRDPVKPSVPFRPYSKSDQLGKK